MRVLERITIGPATLILGDSASMLDMEFDALVTDPPYGVNGGSGTIGKASQKTKYRSSEFDDTRDYILGHVVPTVKAFLSVCKRGVITPGAPNAYLYPPPDDLGALYQPATTGLGKWGRQTVQPVLFYGKDPLAGKRIQNIHYQNTSKAYDDRHPCSKPLDVMMWMVDRASCQGETVVDPFMGSGTTGVACIKQGRRFVGFEIEPRFFALAKENIERELRQQDLFLSTPSEIAQ